MNKLQETKPIWHSMIWIIAYILLVNVGDAISEMIGVPNSATSVILLAFSAVLLLYVNKNHWTGLYGLRWPRKEDLQKVWFYIPLVIIAFLQYFKGLNTGLNFRDIALIVLLMIGVGFIEELLFRGFLFQGILKNGKLGNAIIISGVTFGIGHIVNLLRGYSVVDQSLQIIIGIALGITLTMLVWITNSILPGVVFHTLLNISGNITHNNQTLEVYVVLASIVICLVYSLYLRKNLADRKEPVQTA